MKDRKNLIKVFYHCLEFVR